MQKFLLVCNVLIALSIPGLAAPMDPAVQEGEGSSSGEGTSMEGLIMGWKESAATQGPPDFQPHPRPPTPDGGTTKQHNNMLKKKHPIIITEDYGTHVQGATLTSTLPPGATKLEEPSSHYGVESTDPNKQSHVVKTPLRYAEKGQLAPRPQGIATERLGQEDLDRLKADLCKRGLNAACSLRRPKTAATKKSPSRSQVRQGNRKIKGGTPKAKSQKFRTRPSSKKKTLVKPVRMGKGPRKSSSTKKTAASRKSTARGKGGKPTVKKGRK